SHVAVGPDLSLSWLVFTSHVPRSDCHGDAGGDSSARVNVSVKPGGATLAPTTPNDPPTTPRVPPTAPLGIGHEPHVARQGIDDVLACAASIDRVVIEHEVRDRSTRRASSRQVIASVHDHDPSRDGDGAHVG